MDNNKKTLNSFYKYSAESFQEDESDNNLIYESLGVDKEEYIKSKLNLINKLNLKTKAELNRSKNKELFARAIKKVKQIIDEKVDGATVKLSELLQTQSPQVQYRNLDKLEENDIKELLTDINLIEFIEKLDNIDNDAD